MLTSELDQLAARIPNMGATKAGPVIREYVKEVETLPVSTAIVEVGSWLGGITAYLALGVLDTGRKLNIHVYDRFTASCSEVNKALKFGLTIHEGQDTQPVHASYLKPFGVPITYHQGNIRNSLWTGEPIGIYVDDACKRKPEFDHVRKHFFPSIVSGGILVLMDYYYFVKKNDPSLRYQASVMMHDSHFEMIDKIKDTSAAIFRRE